MIIIENMQYCGFKKPEIRKGNIDVISRTNRYVLILELWSC